jgi:hypothetical protein
MTAATDIEARPVVRPRGLVGSRGGTGRPAVISVAGGALALLAAAAPMGLAAAMIAIQRPDVLPDGDPAVDELALMRSTHLAQLVGNYSRFGWNHPGPAWFYALDPAYMSLGMHSWAFYVGVLGLQGLFAAFVVAAAWRGGGPLLAIVTSGLLLLYVRALGDLTFRDPWPPYALMLPVVLLFLLAGLGAAGSLPAMAGALVVGSFVAQTHVGTVPLVLTVLGVMVVGRVALRWLPRPPAGPTEPRRIGSPATILLTAGGVLLTALMWIPVAVDQVTGRPGNISKLITFFQVFHDRHPYHAAVSALGRMLEVVPLGRFDPFEDLGAAPLDRYVAVAVFLSAAAGLVLVGMLVRDRFALALGVLLCVAVPVAVVSISRIVGPIMPYLAMWATTFPLLLAIGWTGLLVRLRPWARWRAAAARAALRGGAAALCVALVALAAGRAAAFQQLKSVAADYDPGDRVTWAATEAALGRQPSGSVYVDIPDTYRWPVAAALALQLKKRGWTVTVSSNWVFAFGEEERPTGREDIWLVVAEPGSVGRLESQMPDLREIGRTQDTVLLMRRGAGGAGG